MRLVIVKSVKEYVSTYLNEDILISDDNNLEDCKCVKIPITGNMNYYLVLRITLESLEYICNTLFGFASEEMYEDVAKEMINVIAGKILVDLDDGLALGLPEICSNCSSSKKAIIFKNKDLHLSISLTKSRITRNGK